MFIPFELISITDRYLPFLQALEWQYSIQQARRDGVGPDTLLLLEHTPVITLGRVSVPERDLLVTTASLLGSGIEVHEADRGGEITYHAPGQLVGYPIIELREDLAERDLHGYLRKLEQVIIETIREWGIDGTRKDGLTGVWVEDQKIAAIGIKVSRWVTMHGFALNIDIDLTPMREDIVPCGIREFGVTSMRELGILDGRNIVEPVLVEKFEALFGRKRKSFFLGQQDGFGE
jgi:lipoyl(octanoyl) transferase